MRTYVFRPTAQSQWPGIVLYSEIFQLTGPIRRTGAWLAGHGFVVAVPEVYHEFEPAGTVLAYDQAGADRGNFCKYEKRLASYDGDAQAVITWLAEQTAHVGVMGICLGGHLAFRAALLPQVKAAACFYATDLHTASLSKADDSLARAAEIQGELLMIFGRQDPHVPLEGRRKIQARLEEVGTKYSWVEVNAAHAFISDEGPRYDPVAASHCLGMAVELFQRKLR